MSAQKILPGPEQERLAGS